MLFNKCIEKLSNTFGNVQLKNEKNLATQQNTRNIEYEKAIAANYAPIKRKKSKKSIKIQKHHSFSNHHENNRIDCLTAGEIALIINATEPSRIIAAPAAADKQQQQQQQQPRQLRPRHSQLHHQHSHPAQNRHHRHFGKTLSISTAASFVSSSLPTSSLPLSSSTSSSSAASSSYATSSATSSMESLAISTTLSPLSSATASPYMTPSTSPAIMMSNSPPSFSPRSSSELYIPVEVEELRRNLYIYTWVFFLLSFTLQLSFLSYWIFFERGLFWDVVFI